MNILSKRRAPTDLIDVEDDPLSGRSVKGRKDCGRSEKPIRLCIEEVSLHSERDVPIIPCVGWDDG